jgi:hypothetical protein
MSNEHLQQSEAVPSRHLREMVLYVIPTLFCLCFGVTVIVALIYTFARKEPLPTAFVIAASVYFSVVTLPLMVGAIILYFRNRRQPHVAPPLSTGRPAPASKWSTSSTGPQGSRARLTDENHPLKDLTGRRLLIAILERPLVALERKRIERDEELRMKQWWELQASR